MTCKRLSRCYVCKRVPPGQARNRPRIRLKCYFFLPFSAGKRIATPVCALVRNDMLKTGRCQRLQGRFPAVHRQCPLATAHTYPPSACHCEPVRTLVWQSASPQRYLTSWLPLGQIRSTFLYSPKVLLSVMPCRRRSGLPRRFAPRNDMQKHAAVCGCNCVVPGKFVTFFVFALGATFCYALPQELRIATSLRSSQ